MDYAHPDHVEGRWRAAKPVVTPLPHASVSAVDKTMPPSEKTGKTLRDYRAKWVENRVKAKKQVRDDYLRDMDQTVAAFETHAGVSDIGEIRRRHVLAFRDHIGSTSGYKVATVNKKVGFISALLRTALKAGWVENALGENLLLEMPEDEGGREPYRGDDLTGIFSHRIFTEGFRFSRAKACGELQFRLPLIACLHGRISSEILQLGPDTVPPHPDAPDVLCFEVTNAGDRIARFTSTRWRDAGPH